MSEQKEGGISLALLREILAEQSKQNAEQLKSVIEELRKPTALEQKKIDEEVAELISKNEERKSNAQAMIKKSEDKRALQRICTHKGSDGHTHCVFVHDNNGKGTGYILCQRNQCQIRPGAAPAEYNGDVIYDTNLFNALFQTLPSNELFG